MASTERTLRAPDGLGSEDVTDLNTSSSAIQQVEGPVTSASPAHIDQTIDHTGTFDLNVDIVHKDCNGLPVFAGNSDGEDTVMTAEDGGPVCAKLSMVMSMDIDLSSFDLAGLKLNIADLIEVDSDHKDVYYTGHIQIVKIEHIHPASLVVTDLCACSGQDLLKLLTQMSEGRVSARVTCEWES